MQNFFVKSHGLGNDYFVLNEAELSFKLNEKNIQLLCDVHYGIGSDGILLKVPSDKADFGLKIYNPDGSEAEKSGNGLRIFAKYLYDYSHTSGKKFTIETLGGIVTAEVTRETKGIASQVKVDMGKAIFDSHQIPVTCDSPECLDHPLNIVDETYLINCVSVGNPHCVILRDRLVEGEILKHGSEIENHPMFPHRINVQFAKVISRNEVEILIWERGAGYTLASGSSSCAVAAVMVKKGLTDRVLSLKMPGGTLHIEIDEDWNIRMIGEVREIASGYLSDELIADALCL
ncbi:diaminopimelate epimerase [Aquipluma nitroreducens]|uniref:Diaminopimelate epimerase n=1 Tax=Aquipluma nitroreducens TaxID=2010828 RepID=A0A5K7SB55_9BACT|nr:diaminopimelate epimerase [Aquipluma nitroreducens]BBE18808.1 diaminopimelate epimerase [Aquipluma nitroreducens]